MEQYFKNLQMLLGGGEIVAENKFVFGSNIIEIVVPAKKKGKDPLVRVVNEGKVKVKYPVNEEKLADLIENDFYVQKGR